MGQSGSSGEEDIFDPLPDQRSGGLELTEEQKVAPHPDEGSRRIPLWTLKANRRPCLWTQRLAIDQRDRLLCLV